MRTACGDSNVRSLSMCVDRVIEFGGLTCHALGQFGIPSTLDTASGDQVLFAFGEVDVRVHLVKIAEQRKCSIESVIADIASRYVERIRSFCIERQVRGHIIAAPPPIALALPHIPTIDAIEHRVWRAQLMNETLKQMCAQDLTLIDCWQPFRNADGSLNAELSDGGVHVHERFNEMIRELVVPHLS